VHLSNLLQVLSGCRRILILCHHNADPDALGSATALSRLLTFCLPGLHVEVSAPCGMSKVSRKIIPHLPGFSTCISSLSEVDAVVLVDTNTLSQLDDFEYSLRNLAKPIVFIDHHAYHTQTDSIAALYIVDEDASSASEVIFGLYEEAGRRPDRESAQALFLGIAYDTRHFALARSKTLMVVARLVDLGASAEKLLPLLAAPVESSERVARLKAAQRMQCEHIIGWYVVHTVVGSYQASVARALVALGADIAVVGGERRGKLKISMRSSRDFYETTKIHLGRDIASRLGQIMKGAGGGHSTSAGFNGEGKLEDAMNFCLKLIRGSLEGGDKETKAAESISNGKANHACVNEGKSGQIMI